MEGYRHSSIDRYVRDLAANLPAPGGGSGAAVVGALGNALAAMVANFTVGREKFADVEPQVQRILRELDVLRERLLELADEDVRAYSRVSAAFKLPRDTDEQKAVRDAAVEDACKTAADVPRAIAECCDRTIALAAELCDIGNPNLITDIGCAVRLAEAARHCAWLNVAINLVSIKDEAFKTEMLEAVEQAGRKSHEIAEATWKKVVERILS